MNRPFDPQAVWIASPIAGGARSSPAAPFLRRAFSLNQPVESATLTITALGLYECEINGRRVGDEVFAPGWTDYRKRVQYHTFDVTDYLHAGENVVGAVLGDGWYCGYAGWWQRQQYGDRPRLLAQLVVRLRGGEVVTVGSDAAWKTSSGPILEADLMMGEIYDARLELGAWSSAGYDDSAWRGVLVSPPDPVPELSRPPGPPVRRLGEIAPVAVKVLASWCRVVDFGQNFSGRVRIRINAKKGTTVRLRFGEVLKADGNLYTDNLRMARCTDYYTTNGGDSTWEPRFTFHGFRYVEVTDLEAEDSLEITGIVLHSDTAVTGMFRCSHDWLNQLQHNIVWGQKSNFLDVPTDCPQRDERLGWTGDAQVFARTAAFNMDVRGFFHKWMRDCRDAQGESGGIPPVVPNPMPWEKDGGPGWADATIICPWTIYLCYGDRAILEDHYESMKRWLDFTTRERCRDHIRSHFEVDAWGGFGDWLALDGGGQTEGITPKDLIGTALYAHSTDLLARIAEVLGRAEDAAGYRELHGRIVAAFRERFVTPGGLVVSGTQTSYVLALQFGLIPEERRAAATGELVRLIEKAQGHIGTGFLGTPYILEVLTENGRLDVAYRLLEQESFPSWLFPVKNGATTIWERWDGWTPEKGFQDAGMNSFNHYAYGAVGAWMVGTMAGLDLDPGEPGYRHIRFRPHPGGSITWAEARLETARGAAGIHWSLKENADLEIRLTVPEGTRATLLAPASHAAGVREFGAGEHRVVLAKT